MVLLANPFPYDVQFRLGSVTVFSLFLGAALIIPVSVDAWEKISRPVMGKLYGNSGQLGSRNIQRSRFRTTLTVAALMIGGGDDSDCPIDDLFIWHGPGIVD